jgi:hypothetical protein
MLLSKTSLEFASKFVGENDARHALRGVLIERDRLISTDGHMLAMVTPHLPYTAADYPAVPAYHYPDSVDYYAYGPEPLNPALVHVDGVRQLIKAVPKPRRHNCLPVLQNVLIDTERTNLNGHLHAHVTDLENPQAFSIRKMDAQFPPYEQVLPKDAPCYSIAVNPAYLKQIGEAFTKMDAKAVVLEFWSDRSNQPIRITGQSADREHDALVLLMPIKHDKAHGLTQTVKRWAQTICGDDLSGYDVK